MLAGRPHLIKLILPTEHFHGQFSWVCGPGCGRKGAIALAAFLEIEQSYDARDVDEWVCDAASATQ